MYGELAMAKIIFSKKLTYTKFKRFFDIIFSSLSILFFIPLFFVVAILIYIFDNGPVIYKQYRTGKGGDEFLIYKFRSLPVNTKLISSDALPNIKTNLIGRILRRTNIDDLPQMFNILRGDMSFVGPRPPLPSQIELIKLRHQNKSIYCYPGLTGLAQIRGYNGMSVIEKAKLDAIYLKNISFANDLIIIFSTFFYLLRKQPKY